MQYFIRPNGDDAAAGDSLSDAWRTLNMCATGLLRPGDTVRAAGAFPLQAISPSRDGTADAPITITSYDRANPAVVDMGWSAPDTPGTLVQAVDRSHVTFEHLRLTNTRWRTDSTITAASGVTVWGGAGVTVRWCSLSNVAIRVVSGSGHRILHNTVEDAVTRWGTYVHPDGRAELRPLNQGDAITLYAGATGCEVAYNTVRGAGHAGISAGNGDTFGARGWANRIHHNTVINPYATPLYLADDSCGVAEYNTLALASRQPAYAAWVDPAHLEAGGVPVQARPGLGLRGSSWTVRGNRIVSPAGPGIWLSAFVGESGPLNCDGNEVERNEVSGAGEEGLRITREAGVSLRGNHVRRNRFEAAGRATDTGARVLLWLEAYAGAEPFPAAMRLDANRIAGNKWARADGVAGGPFATVVRPGQFMTGTLAQFQARYPAAARGNRDVVGADG